MRELQARSHATRSAITRPRFALRIHITDPVVREAAEAMVTATYGMRDACDNSDTLAEARRVALEAHDHFMNVAAAYLHP